MVGLQATRRSQFANAGSNTGRNEQPAEKTERIHFLNWCPAKQAAINPSRGEVSPCSGRVGQGGAGWLKMASSFALSSWTRPHRIHTVNSSITILTHSVVSSSLWTKCSGLSGQFHVTVFLPPSPPPAKELSVHIRQEAGWAQTSVWMWWWREKSLSVIESRLSRTY
jgi:hypothetical protein